MARPRKTITEMRCYGCHIVKKHNGSNFYKDNSRYSGLARLCKQCHNKKGKVRSQLPPHKYLSYKFNAKNRGKSFDITFEEFCSFWQKPCYYCGFIIKTIGLDRVDSKLGYQMDNIVPCCKPCNLAKRTLSKDSFILLACQIARIHGQK